MCGIAGAYNVHNASYCVSVMLKALQHRGQEAAGILSNDDNKRMHVHKDFGLLDEVFRGIELPKTLPGSIAIGHVRYSTTGERSLDNIQPFVAHQRDG